MHRLSAFLRRFHDDRSGASTVVVGLCSIVLLGSAGLATDVAGWYAARREAQHAADSAAFSAATAIAAGGSDYEAQGKAIVAAYGLRDGEDGARIIVNEISDAGGPKVEVIVEQPARRIFSRLFLIEGRTIRARAAARVGRSGDGCVLALHPSASEAALIDGASEVKLDGCALVANSTSNAGLTLKGASRLDARNVILGGPDYVRAGASRLQATAGVALNQPPVTDPYANLSVSPSGCDYLSEYKVSGVGEHTIPNNGLDPTVFCGGLKISGSLSKVLFKPGVYILYGGSLDISGTSNIEGDGVTIILSRKPGSSHAKLKITGAGKIDLRAPATGPYAGVVFYQTPDAPAGNENEFRGATSTRIQGAIYMPAAVIDYRGASSSDGGCTQLIASRVIFGGAADFALDCEGVGVRPIGARRTVLVE